VRAHLTAIDPDTGATHEVLDVSGTDDRRVVFPADDRMILMAQHGGAEKLVLFDTTTRTRIASVTKPTWYWGTRTAPSGRALVVADNELADAPLHVIDTATLSHRVIEHDGDAIEAMWNHGSDILFAVSAIDPFGTGAVARVHRYDLRGASFGSPLPPPTRTWAFPGLGWDFWFSYTWITISPDDRWAVFPLIDRRVTEGDPHVLVVLDQTTGTTAVVHGRGPVAFTRDSRWIVSYGTRADGGQDLWLVDAATHERRVVTMPFTASIMFHASRDTDHIVCVPVLGSGGEGVWGAVHDVASGTVTALDAPIDLYDFVTRPGHGELWLETWGAVTALDLATATTTPVDLGATEASSINVRPIADHAVIGDGGAASIEVVDMATRARSRDPIELPSPFDAGAAGSLGAARSGAVGPARAAQSPFDPAYAGPVERRPGRL
jgi:hypothetical protein